MFIKGDIMKKFLSVVLAVFMIALVGCAQSQGGDSGSGSSSGSGSGSGDWTPVIELSQSEMMSMFSQAATWESDNESGSAPMGIKICVKWTTSTSYISYVIDFKDRSLTETQKAQYESAISGAVKEAAEGTYFSSEVVPTITPVVSWNGNVLTAEVETGYYQNSMPRSAVLLMSGDISVDRKTVRIDASGDVIYFKKVN